VPRIKHSVEKSIAKSASAIVQRWNVGCEYRLTVGKRRVDNSESSFLDLLYLVTKVHREVVVPRVACIYSWIVLTHTRYTLTGTESGRAFLFNCRRAYKRLEAFMAFTCKFHFKSFEMVTIRNDDLKLQSWLLKYPRDDVTCQ
jgi:hypothetical protein